MASRYPDAMAWVKLSCSSQTSDAARTRVWLSGTPVRAASATKHSQMNRQPIR